MQGKRTARSLAAARERLLSCVGLFAGFAAMSSASSTCAAEASSFFRTLSDPGNPRVYIFKGASRDGKTVYFRNALDRPYVMTIGGVAHWVVTPANGNRIDQDITGLTPDGSAVYGWAQYQISNVANEYRFFRYNLTGTLVEYTPADASNVSVIASDPTGSAITGSYNTLVNGTLVHQAYLWRPDSNVFTMISGLEGLGSTATATGISGDGSTVIGNGERSGAVRAFRYTSGGGTQLLGTLGDSNSAKLVSRDGTVIGGDYTLGAASNGFAFRWTTAGGMQDIGTLGATVGANNAALTTLKAMNETGSVLVGNSAISNANSIIHAFRWTAANGGTMEDLAAPASSRSSIANDVSEDGNVIIGNYLSKSQADGGFYWTRDGGMRSVDDALRAAGVTLATDIVQEALRISADGTVVTGMTKAANGQLGDIYFAKIARAASGIVTQQNLVHSLETAYQPQVSNAMAEINLLFNGVGGLPMRTLMEAGQGAYWNTLDTGYTDRGRAEGGFGVGEIGFAEGLEGGITARMGLSGAYANLNLENDGHLVTRGFYIAPDLTVPIGETLYLTLGAAFGIGRADITRGYINGSALDFSSGSADLLSYGGKIRIDWLDAATLGETAFTPYAALNYAHVSRSGYGETGGAFPATFGRSDNDMTIARLGVDLVHPLKEDMRLLARAEMDYRFEDQAENTTGTVTGIGAFAVAGTSYQHLWLRGAIGGEWDMGGGTASLTLNATTNGSEPDLWLRASWRKPF